jgi:hypothetical protein
MNSVVQQVADAVANITSRVQGFDPDYLSSFALVLYNNNSTKRNLRADDVGIFKEHTHTYIHDCSIPPLPHCEKGYAFEKMWGFNKKGKLLRGKSNMLRLADLVLQRTYTNHQQMINDLQAAAASTDTSGGCSDSTFSALAPMLTTFDLTPKSPIYVISDALPNDNDIALTVFDFNSYQKLPVISMHSFSNRSSKEN